MSQCQTCQNQDGAECVGCQGWKRPADDSIKAVRFRLSVIPSRSIDLRHVLPNEDIHTEGNHKYD